MSRVLKGTTDEDSLKISQRYGILDEPYQLVTFSEMTAMEKGDEWIFFLYYDDSNDTYWCSGDYTGRYPLPDDSLTAVCNEVNQSEKKERTGYPASRRMLQQTQTTIMFIHLSTVVNIHLQLKQILIK